MVYARAGNPPVVTSALGLTRWADHYGRPHTVKILEAQLEYNALLAAKIAGSKPPRNFLDITYDSSYSVPVTGILDIKTLSIPCLKGLIRNIDQRRSLDNVAQNDFFHATKG